MALRDLLITAIVFGGIPYVLLRPHVGILLWSWIGYMNPHRLSWGFAYNFPFAAIVGAATIGAFFLSREPKKIPLTGLTVLLILLNLWFVVTSAFAIYPYAWEQWDKVAKIQLMVFLTLALMNRQERIHQLVWIIVISLGFYGVKGGIFAILTGGQYMVLGPANTFISGNTELALALVMTLPLMRYLHLQAKNPWVSRALLAAMLLTGLAIVASYSRGAFLALAAMSAFLWLKSRHKLPLALSLLVAAPLIFAFMPQKYFDRIATIKNYEQNDSAMGRIDAWTFATKMALARPLTGGGFESFTQDNYQRFAPEVVRENGRFQDAHSIYFEVLGEHGFIGLTLFLATGLLGWRTGKRVITDARDRPELRWASDLAAMIQVSLIGYAVGGAFLGLAYFDLYYHLLAMVILLKLQVQGYTVWSQDSESAPLAPPTSKPRTSTVTYMGKATRRPAV